MMEKTTPRALLQTRSLRFWIMAGMFMALTPVVIAAVSGFILLNRGVIASFQYIADRQRTEIVPAQRIGLMLGHAAISVDEFVEEGNTAYQASFRSQQTAIDAEFATLIESVGNDPMARALAKGAQEDWKAAQGIGGELVSILRPPGDAAGAQPMKRFDGAIRSASDKLEGLVERLEDDVGEDQDNADITYERAIWLAGIAGGVCLLAMIGAVRLIGRIMSASVDRLVDGAQRFALGDRVHRIDVRIPPELRRVAAEFNRMIIKIHSYEDILAERALKDVLTGLPNRRAFEEAMAQNWNRRQQCGESFAVLLIDIDHFKRVNDTYGHAAGDEVLRHVAGTVAQQLRTAHPIFRTGGEEFAVIVPSSGVVEARVIAERLRGAVPVVSVGEDIRVTISVGVTDSHGFGSPEAMLQAADAALYRAKTQGRDQVVTSGDRSDLGHHAA